MGRSQLDFMKRLASGWKPELFHLHVADYGSLYRKLAYLEQVKALGVPALVHLNGYGTAHMLETSAVHRTAFERMFRLADGVITQGSEAARMVRRHGGRAIVLSNPVDCERFEREGGRSAADEVVVLFMGIFGDRKGTFDLVEVIPGLSSRFPNVRFRFGGNGEVDRLRAAVRGMDNVEVLGWIDGAEVPKAFHGADVYCLPSYGEGQPISVLEAMAAELPVVTTGVSSTPDALDDGVEGFLIEPGDLCALEERLSVLIGDEARRLEMGRAAGARVRRQCAGPVVARDLEAIWLGMVS